MRDPGNVSGSFSMLDHFFQLSPSKNNVNYKFNLQKDNKLTVERVRVYFNLFLLFMLESTCVAKHQTNSMFTNKQIESKIVLVLIIKHY